MVQGCCCPAPSEGLAAAATLHHHQLHIRQHQKISCFGADGVVIPNAHCADNVNADGLRTRPAGHPNQIARTHARHDNRLAQSGHLGLDCKRIIASQLAEVKRQGVVLLALVLKRLDKLVDVHIRSVAALFAAAMAASYSLSLMVVFIAAAPFAVKK